MAIGRRARPSASGRGAAGRSTAGGGRRSARGAPDDPLEGRQCRVGVTPVPLLDAEREVLDQRAAGVEDDPVEQVLAARPAQRIPAAQCDGRAEVPESMTPVTRRPSASSRTCSAPRSWWQNTSSSSAGGDGAGAARNASSSLRCPTSSSPRTVPASSPSSTRYSSGGVASTSTRPSSVVRSTAASARTSAASCPATVSMSDGGRSSADAPGTRRTTSTPRSARTATGSGTATGDTDATRPSSAASRSTRSPRPSSSPRSTRTTRSSTANARWSLPAPSGSNAVSLGSPSVTATSPSSACIGSSWQGHSRRRLLRFVESNT
jgi:hypothetical protein